MLTDVNYRVSDQISDPTDVADGTPGVSHSLPGCQTRSSGLSATMSDVNDGPPDMNHTPPSVRDTSATLSDTLVRRVSQSGKRGCTHDKPR
jgi:hypothetical protein